MNNGQRFHRHIVALKRAWRSLANHGPTKQRREKALKALRGLRAEVDNYKPQIKRKKGAPQPKTLEGREARLMHAGWRYHDNPTFFRARLIPVRSISGYTRKTVLAMGKVEEKLARVKKRASRKYLKEVLARYCKEDKETWDFVPEWAAVLAKSGDATLRRAAKDPKFWRIAVTEAKLKA